MLGNVLALLLVATFSVVPAIANRVERQAPNREHPVFLSCFFYLSFTLSFIDYLDYCLFIPPVSLKPRDVKVAAVVSVVSG